MDKNWLLPLLSFFIAVQFMIPWPYFATAQVSGFLSIDCGSKLSSIYTDDNKIEWTPDSNMITEGTPQSTNGITFSVMATMRLFDSTNQSKYCYTLTNSAVKPGAIFLVRASFAPGVTPPYTPQGSDGRFRFKLIVDSDHWIDVNVPYGSNNWYFYEIYMIALRSSIDVCVARSKPDGDAPFISALELRPLPSTLNTAFLMNGTNRNFLPIGHADYGVTAATEAADGTRYPLDPLDRLWLAYTDTTTISTSSDISTNIVDKPPARILQSSSVGNGSYFNRNFTGLEPNSVYVAEFYFAEIDAAVNATGQRLFDIVLVNGANGPEVVNKEALDIYALVGPKAAYAQLALATSDSNGLIFFNFSATATSAFPPFLAAAELFMVYNESFHNGSWPADVIAIEDLKTSMNLSSSTGDPCLPAGYGYSWLTCTAATTTATTPRITSISLSKYGASGKIPETINALTMLEQISMDWNNLEGSIPDLSTLTNLKTLDLSNNKLSGSIPESLATLTNLKVLNLQNNNLSGQIPAALLEAKAAATLNFDFSGNPSLCENNPGVVCETAPASENNGGSPRASPGSGTAKSSSSKVGVIVGVVVGVVLVAAAITFLVFCLCHRKPRPTSQHPPPVKPIPKLSIQEFSFEEIKIATNNFSTQLGIGGFGPVYKGTLKDGCIVAIKVASNSSHQGSREFLNEVDLLSRVHHKNLVGLLGYCYEEKLVLVYEYMGNGSLYDCLHGRYAKASPLPWNVRLRILVDAAQGFDYLHYGCNPRIIHRDVKSSNILLNDQMEAKISDFGISRNSVINDTTAPMTTLMGSMGYMDPEYLATMRLTEKVDVYSFGVVLFEVVCGRPVVFGISSEEQIHIVEWAKSYVERGIIEEIMDPTMQNRYDVSSVWKVLEVALACVQYSSAQRPKMSAVFLELKEAEQIEFESEKRNAFNKPSGEFYGSDHTSTTFTHVSAR